MFTDRLKGLRMSSVLLAVLLLSPVAGLVRQAYPACVPDYMEHFQPILSQDPGITVPGSWPSRLAQLSYNLFFRVLSTCQDLGNFSPESVRWFLVKGKTKQAENILHKVAKFNKKPIPHEKLQDCEKQRLGDLRDLFKSKSIAHKTLVSWFCWFVNGMVYYGVSFSSPTVGGNMYLNFFITSTIALVAYPALAWGCNRFGRKKTICCGLFFSAFGAFGSVLLTLFDDGKNTGILVGKIIFSLCIAKFFIVFAFDGFYVYSAELFPTVIRNIGMGTSTSAARVGSFLSPYVVFSQRVHPLLPFGIMGINALIAALLCMTLPETRNQPTLETFTTSDQQGDTMKEMMVKESDNGHTDDSRL